MSGTRKIFLFLALPLVIVFGVIMFFTLGDRGNNTNSISDNNSPATPSGQCPALITPVDVSLVTAVLYPGQIRGEDYKPHGGFSLSGLGSNLVNIKAPLDAQITLASRYLEMDEIQYLFEFENGCGLKYRFDHLKTLSSKLQAIADKLPAAKVDDSRTTEVKGKISVTAGEIVATAVGFENGPAGAPAGPLVGFDFGLYDTREKNESSKDPAWVVAHQEDGDQAIHAVCWLDWLPASDSVILKALPGADGQSGKQSDYCK